MRHRPMPQTPPSEKLDATAQKTLRSKHKRGSKEAEPSIAMPYWSPLLACFCFRGGRGNITFL